MLAKIFFFFYFFLFVWHIDSLLLTKNSDVSSISLGGVATSSSLNPALVNKQNGHVINFFHQFGFANNDFSHIQYSSNFLSQFFEFGFTYLHPIRIEAIDDFGVSLGSSSVTEYLLRFQWSNLIKWNFFEQWWIPHQIEYGLSLKGYYSYLYSFPIYTIALDGGFRVVYGIPGISYRDSSSQANLQIYLSVRNLGIPLKFLDHREVLPMQVFWVTQYTPFELYQQKASLFFQIEYTKGLWVSYVLSFELEIFHILYLRGGYRFPDNIRNIFFGCEIKYDLLKKIFNVSIQYSVSPLLSLGFEHNISFTLAYSLRK